MNIRNQSHWQGDRVEVRFDTTDAFADEFAQNITQGGLYLNLDPAPKLHQLLKLSLVVKEHRFHIEARCVFVSAKGVGLQLEPIPESIKTAMHELVGKTSANQQEPQRVSTETPSSADDAAMVEMPSQNQAKVLNHVFDNTIDMAKLLRGGEKLPRASLYYVINNLNNVKASAILKIKGPDIADRFRLEFVNGLQVHSKRFLESRDIGVMLKKEKVLNSLKLDRALAEAKTKGVTLSQALIALGYCDEETIARILRIRLTKHFATIFSLQKGSYALIQRSEHATEANSILVEPANLLFRGLLLALANLNRSEIEEMVKPISGKYLVAQINALDLSGDEYKLWQAAVEGTMSVNQLTAVSPFRKQDTLCLLASWVVSGCAIATQSCPRIQGGAKEGEVEVLFEIVSSKDFYQCLGVHWSHPPAKLADAFESRLKHLNNIGQHVKSAGGKKKLRDVETKVNEAYAVLSNSAKRKAYLKDLVSDYQRKQSAHLLYSKVETLIFRKQLREAREVVEACMELDPKNTAYVEMYRQLGGT